MEGQVKKNLIYNFVYQLLAILLPFITIPYVSRILGPTGVGVYSYTYSVVYYFMLIALLGINNYGNRKIAKSRDNIDELSKNFLSIYLFQLIMSIIMVVLYLIYIFCICSDYKMIAIIQIIYLIANTFDINWFFYGLENFKLAVIRSSIIKVLALILIFLFVKKENDIWVYTLILSSSTLINQLILWPFLIKRIKLVKIKIEDITSHIKPCLILFVPVIAVSLYRVVDKIMIGLLSNIENVGYYEQSEKILNVPITFINAFGAVMLPRVSNLLQKGEIKKIKEYIDKSMNLVMFLAFPMCLGIIGISNNFIPIFLGSGFETSIYIIYISAFIIVFASFANPIRTQYLIPQERDKDYIICTVLGAIVNLILNFIFIPMYGALGAAIGTLFAEFVVMFYQAFSVRKVLPIRKYIFDVIPFFSKSLVMFIIIYPLCLLDINKIVLVLIQILIGVTIYCLLNVNYIKSIILNRMEKSK